MNLSKEQPIFTKMTDILRPRLNFNLVVCTDSLVVLKYGP